MNDLLVRLGKRVHALRAAKKWSQEEFAHISGLHRTYIGQIERGEKNISFGNLSKISGVLGVTLSELLSGLEDGTVLETELEQRPESRVWGQLSVDDRMLKIHKLVKRLSIQRAAMDRTIVVLEELAVRGNRTRTPSRGRTSRRGVSKK